MGFCDGCRPGEMALIEANLARAEIIEEKLLKPMREHLKDDDIESCRVAVSLLIAHGDQGISSSYIEDIKAIKEAYQETTNDIVKDTLGKFMRYRYKQMKNSKSNYDLGILEDAKANADMMNPQTTWQKFVERIGLN